MKNEEFGCAMQACRKVILHSSFLVLHFDKLSFTFPLINAKICKTPELSSANAVVVGNSTGKILAA